MRIDSESLRIGVPLIDRQHEAYFAMTDRLFELAERGTASRSGLRLEVDQVVRYAMEHFDAEEYFMRSISYPRYEEHRRKHNLFRDKVDVFVIDLTDNVDVGDYMARLSLWLIEWFCDQVRVDDRRLAAFVRKRNENG